MSTTTATCETEDKLDRSHTTNSSRNCTYWIRDDDGREFITDPNGEIVNLSRLTAYAEHGEKIYDAEAHHKLPLLKVDAPKFIDALSTEEHRRLHRQDVNRVEVDGIPVVQADS